jgi:hypothetical protein
MEMLEIYLKDNARRLFEVDESLYIKRVYKESEIIFECTNEPTVTVLKTNDEVNKWFDEQMAERLNISLDVVNYCNNQKANNE